MPLAFADDSALKLHPIIIHGVHRINAISTVIRLNVILCVCSDIELPLRSKDGKEIQPTTKGGHIQVFFLLTN